MRCVEIVEHLREGNGMETANATQSVSIKGMRFVWVEYIKAIALFWIFLVHAAERVFGYELIANPTSDWLTISDRIRQLAPLHGFGLLDIPINLFRYIGWSGDQGVQLFLIISGFGLTWGLLGRYSNRSLPLMSFYRRRAERIYPMWWISHIFLLILSFFLQSLQIQHTDYRFYASLLGIRFTPSLFYYASCAWWYVSLLIQLYLIYPLLWEMLRRFKARNFLVITLVMSFAVRGIGLLVLQHSSYLDAWSRGAIFITRLPEFVFGMALAYWFFSKPTETARYLNRPMVLGGAVVAYVVGTILVLDLIGMTVAVFLVSLGTFLLLYILLNNLPEPASLFGRAMKWIGVHSFAIYLIHTTFIEAFIPGLFGINIEAHLLRVFISTLAAFLVTIPVAMLLEWIEKTVVSGVSRLSQKMSFFRSAGVVVFTAVVCVAVVIGLEFLTRQLSPQEYLGWGERESLEPDTWVAWHLKPSTTTRLRWQTYDYTVTANSLGFPGSDYPVEIAPNTFRIMVTGDAFSSAEGVDTNQAWPYVLNQRLSTQSTEVMNFAITGYGPNQYAEVIQKYAPTYKPDLIIVEMFVNDYEDVAVSDNDFRNSIGFQLKGQKSVAAILGLENLRQFASINVAERLNEFLTGIPIDTGYRFGNFAAFQVQQTNLDERKAAVKQRLSEIQVVAKQINAQLMIVMVPASIQICTPSELPYFPHYINLSDTTRFDLDLPQRNTKAITDELGINFDDLRPVLSSISSGCPYQPANMHWLLSGHQAVAEHLAEVVANKHS